MGPGNIAVNKADKFPTFVKFIFYCRERVRERERRREGEGREMREGGENK